MSFFNDHLRPVAPPPADAHPPTTFWGRVLHALRYAAAGYGPLIAVLASSPAIIYFSIQPSSGTFTGMLSVDGPLPAAVSAVTGPDEAKANPTPVHLTPTFVKGIYVSAAAAGSRQLFSGLVDLVDRTELNAMVIDVKMENGALAFATDDPDLQPYVTAHPSLGKLEDFTRPLREKGIYLIARLFVFQDPYYAEKHPENAVQDNVTGGLWRDRKGIPWVDPANEVAWRYTAEVARAVVRGGFDEVQFDYIRFPTDGQLSRMKFPVWDGDEPKAEVMGRFFSFLDSELRHHDRMRLSVDLFGLVTWHHETDLNIGQNLKTAVRHFNWISPMVYPSHYPPGFDGFANPAEHPYEIVFRSLERAKQVTDPLAAEDKKAAEAGQPFVPVAAMRPWIQDFDLGADYTPEMVRAQMKATEDAGAAGWLLWNARNSYTEGALLPVGTDSKEQPKNDNI